MNYISSDVTHYLTEVARHPVLCEEAQLHHARRIHKWVTFRRQIENGDTLDPEINYKSIERNGRRSMDAMVRTNLRIVINLAKRNQKRGLELSDLIQEGNRGLIRGLERFDPARGYRMSTYVYWWIRQGINRALQISGRTIRIPINHFELIFKSEHVVAEHRAKTGATLALEEVAEIMKVDPKRLQDILSTYYTTYCTSYDTPSLVEHNTNNPQDKDNKIEFMAAPETSDPAVLMEQTANAERNADIEYINSKLNELPPREAYILKEFYIHNKTTRELAIELGVGVSRINQLQQAALRRIRNKIGDYEFENIRT